MGDRSGKRSDNRIKLFTKSQIDSKVFDIINIIIQPAGCKFQVRWNNSPSPKSVGAAGKTCERVEHLSEEVIHWVSGQFALNLEELFLSSSYPRPVT